MSAEYTRRNPDPGAVATPLRSLSSSPWLLPALVLTSLCALLVVVLGVRPLMAAAWLTDGTAALERASESGADRETLARAAYSLEQAQSLEPTNPLPLRRLAELAMLEGRPADAISFLEAALRLEPTSLLIRRELMFAYLDGGRHDDAALMLAELSGGPSDMLAVGDMEVRAGKLERAFATYSGLIAAAEQPRPELFVRAALTAAALGDSAEAARLLRASGAPASPEPVLAAMMEGSERTGSLFPADVQVNGLPQAIDSQAAMLLLGQGWFGSDPNFGRWVSSPADLLVFLPAAQRVVLDLAVISVHEPDAQYGMGFAGVLDVAVDGRPGPRADLLAQQRNRVALDLPAGWSLVTLSLDAGTFRPQDYNPASGDVRPLSFAVAEVDLVTVP